MLVLVGAVVVQNQMRFLVAVVFGIDLAEELQKLLMELPSLF